MQINTDADARQALATMLEYGVVESIRRTNVGTVVRVERGTTAYVLTIHWDDKVRWNMVAEYGNGGEFVHGVGCDASGYVLGRDQAQVVRDLVAQEG